MDRDFDMEKVIDKMRELRDRRDLEILRTDLNNINLDNDYKKELPKNKVLDVKYLGAIDWEDEVTGEKLEKGIYLVIEQMEKDGELIRVEKYYTEDYEFLGGNNKGDLRDFILLKEEYSKNQKLLEKLNKLDKEGILSLNEIEQERLEEIARVLGVNTKEIDKITEIDKDQIKDAEEKIDQNEEGKEVITEKELEKVSSKQEIEINQKVTDNETMASLLNIQNKGYKKLAIIYSDKMEGTSHTRFSVVGIKEDGSAEKIDSLEQRYGVNPTKEINSLNRDGSEIETKQTQSIFSIKGENEKQISVRIGTMGTIETDLVRTPRQDNQKAISVPIENNNVRPTTRETRELMNQQRNPDVSQEVKRVENHKKLGCEDATIKDINDNPYDDTHEHAETIDEMYLRSCVKSILEDDVVASNYGRDYVRDKVIEKITEKDYLSKDEIIEEVKVELQEKSKYDHEYYEKSISL